MSDEVLWMPSDQRMRNARITGYLDWLRHSRALTFADYGALWRWSVTDLEGFWGSLWDYFGIHCAAPFERVLASSDMPGATWFPGARLNFTDQVFANAAASRPAVIARSESGAAVELGWPELARQVASVASFLRASGVRPGDRVAAYIPNVPEAVVAFLASASVGAIWSACSPDMGVRSVLDRFRQIAPAALFSCDGYRYGGKSFDRRDAVDDLCAALPSVHTHVRVPLLGLAHRGDRATGWDVAAGRSAQLSCEALPFDHPLWIVYSSGTTGLPKPIVHGHGGVLLEALKLAVLHNDLGPGDRFHWYTSSGWIMWNLQVAALLSGATICLYDGSPAWPDLGTLWRFAADVEATFVGAGAAFYASCAKHGVKPRALADLAKLRSIGSTGSPLADTAYRWLAGELGADVWIAPISGGTDVASAFVGGLPTLPVYAGEMQCRCLGVKVEAWTDDGRSVVDQVGELVVTAPMPSMPLFFWNDRGMKRYRESYFEQFPGVWRHGDWIRLTPRSGAIIYGRSDATINRHGIRIGTAELYRAVESLPEVLDSLIVDLEYVGRESYMPLFVVLRDGVVLDQALRDRIVGAVRNAVSPRHAPDDIFAVAEIPRTLSGKKLEVPVKRLLLGHSAEQLVNADAMTNPQAIRWFIDFAQNRTATGADGVR